MKILKSIIFTTLILFSFNSFSKECSIPNNENIKKEKLKIKTSLKDIVEDNKLVGTKFIVEVVIKGESHLVEVEKFINN